MSDEERAALTEILRLLMRAALGAGVGSLNESDTKRLADLIGRLEVRPHADPLQD